MSLASANLLSLPNELLDKIPLHLEFAYEINSLSQTCRRLYSVANRHLFGFYANDCSPRGIERLVKNNNVDALRKLLDNGLRFDQYFRATRKSTPIEMTVDGDLSGIAELLVAYSDAAVEEDECGTSRDLCKNSMLDSDTYRDDLRRALNDASIKGSLGVSKAIANCNTRGWRNRFAVECAIARGHLALVKYFIEEHSEKEGLSSPNRLVSFLTKAAGIGNLEMVKYFVKAGTNLHHPCFQSATQSPLVMAAARNHGAVVQYLTEIGMRFPCLKLHDTLYLEKLITDKEFTMRNIIQPDELKTFAADPLYQSLPRSEKDKFMHVVAACDDLPLYQALAAVSDSCNHLQKSFDIALSNGNLPFVRYLVDEIIEMGYWEESWQKLIFTAGKNQSVAGFEILLDRGPPETPVVGGYWLQRLLFNARQYSKHMEVLLQRGYLNGVQGPRTVRKIFAGPFKAGSLPFVWRLMEHTGLGLLDTLDDLNFKYHDWTVLRLAASYSSLVTFRELLSARSLALGPNNPAHCSALATAALKTNVDVVGYFLEKGFDTNALYPMCASRKSNAPEALIIQVASVARKKHAATVKFLLDHGAQIDTKSSQGRTALSLAVEVWELEVANLLYDSGADPLDGLELRANLSALEQLIWLFVQSEDDVGYLNMLQASFEAMRATGFANHVPHRMSKVEDTRSCTRLIPLVKDDRDVIGSLQWVYNGPDTYVGWSKFFLIRELRKGYWRAMYPVPSD